MEERSPIISWVVQTLREAFWAVALVLVFWAVAAKVFHAYILYPWLDMPTHFAGGLVAAYFVRTAIAKSQMWVGPTPIAVQLVASLGLAGVAAIIWECLEYLSDQFLGSHLNLGVTDTLSDQIFGLAGATVYVAYGLFRGDHR